MNRREYEAEITVNSRRIRKVIIGAHYEGKHRETINDDLILRLVRLLDGGVFPAQDRNGAFEYFMTDQMKLDGKLYKLVWLLEDEQLYIGVINAYRRK